jgi:cobalamin biosynthesis protein CbiD
MVISGRGGLGVLGREGLVKPVSLVRSAVEARLIVLARERRRWLLVRAGR